MHQRALTRAMIGLWRDGATMAQIASRYGVTKQAVSARIRRNASPADRSANRRAVAAARRDSAAEAERERLEALRAAGKVCPLPWCDKVVDGRIRTCSPEHGHEWSVVRRYFDADQYDRHRRAWAPPFDGPDPPPPNRRFRVPGSEADRILKAHGL